MFPRPACVGKGRGIAGQRPGSICSDRLLPVSGRPVVERVLTTRRRKVYYGVAANTLQDCRSRQEGQALRVGLIVTRRAQPSIGGPVARTYLGAAQCSCPSPNACPAIPR